ncbi:hypothetical protein DPMN_090130 [Dreissena polymorpha]|uniref:Uncharacterized protein n=1 Tax=Dreissena polymorpha TaxID=45954 RepID=A0A9D4QZI7_DREPO|nr:hypothetical protein DPMN_090130 [Dreissena polymorpha]
MCLNRPLRISYKEHRTNKVRPEHDSSTCLPTRAPYGDRQLMKVGLVLTSHQAGQCERLEVPPPLMSYSQQPTTDLTGGGPLYCDP